MKLLKWVRHFFTPHQTNNHKAKILHPSVLVIIVSLFLIYQFAINFTLLLQPSILGFATSISPERVIELTNQERLKSGLSPLKLNHTLSQAAQLKAGDMFAFNYWAHNSPSGRTPWDFFNQAGYAYIYAGENLARDFMNSEAVVSAWMNSSSHKENILNGHYQEIGLAVVNGTLEGVETTLVVQMFGTPTPSPVAEETSSPLTSVPQELVTEPVVITQTGPGVSTLTPRPTPLIGEEALIKEKIGTSFTLTQAREEINNPPLFSPFWLTKTVAVFLLGIILGALVLDVVLVARKKVVRLSGRNLAHLIFVATLLLAVLLTTPGAIL